MTNELMPPVHPGEILVEDYLKPLGLTRNRLANLIHVDAPRINDIALGRRSITADTALRLARVFGTTDGFWLNLQARYDLEVERDRIAPALDAIQLVSAAGCAGD